MRPNSVLNTVQGHSSVMPLASGQGGLEFGSSVTPIPIRGVDYAHHITACPPEFENLTASLQFYIHCTSVFSTHCIAATIAAPHLHS